MGVKKLGLDHIALLGQRGRGNLSWPEGRDQENTRIIVIVYFQEFTHLEEGAHGEAGEKDEKASHAVSEFITVMGHVRPFHPYHMLEFKIWHLNICPKL